MSMQIILLSVRQPSSRHLFSLQNQKAWKIETICYSVRSFDFFFSTCIAYRDRMTTLIANSLRKTNTKMQPDCGIGCEQKWRKQQKIMNLFAFLYVCTGIWTGCEVSALKTFLASRFSTHMQKSDAVNNFRSIRRGTKKWNIQKNYFKLAHCDSLMFICGRFSERVWEGER